MFWLLGCFIPGSESSFPPPNQAASAARRILLSFDPNVTGQRTAHFVRRTLHPIVGPNFFHF
jgi:hypothetical protein